MADTIVEDFLKAIGSGELLERETVPAESALATKYRVSRSVVREATRTLAAKGFLIASQGSATTVSPRENWNVLDPEFLAVNSGDDFFMNLQEARELLEPGVAALAAAAVTDEQLNHLDELHRLFCESDDPEMHARLDIQFHKAIAGASRNPVLGALHGLFSALGRRTRVRSAELPGAVDRARYWHGEILEALRSRDPDATESAMRQHLQQVRGELSQLGIVVTSRDEPIGNR